MPADMACFALWTRQTEETCWPSSAKSIPTRKNVDETPRCTHLSVTALPVLRLCLGFHRLPGTLNTEFNATTDERIRELSAKLLERRIRASSWALAEQLKIALDTYVREHTRHV